MPRDKSLSRDDLIKNYEKIVNCGCSGVCYDFALNCGLLVLGEKCRKVDKQLVQEFTHWGEHGTSEPQVWSIDFMNSFNSGDVLVMVHPNDEKVSILMAGKQSHFMIACDKNQSHFAGINNPATLIAGSNIVSCDCKTGISIFALGNSNPFADKRPEADYQYVRIPRGNLVEFMNHFSIKINHSKCCAICTIQ